MTPPVGIDPGALLCGLGEDELVEAHLSSLANRWALVIERENGDEITLHLRADFLDEFLAQARARAADAA